MKWVPDRTGRFAQRPHYEAVEIDLECERTITDFLQRRRGAVSFPISTDDLIVLLEEGTSDVDIYADLSADGPDVEGVTYFKPGGKPEVRIARRLAEEVPYIHRFRTTATHELGHVKFHNFLWLAEARPASLFPDETVQVDTSPRCRRETIQPLSRTDWMEWQAGYACGAFLMPLTHIKVMSAEYRARKRWSEIPNVGSDHAGAVIAEVSLRFDVSADAARIRLTQLGLLTTQAQLSGHLFT